MSLNVWSPSAQPLENHRPRRQRKQQQKPHLTFVLTNLMRTRTFWSWNGKKCSSEELDQKRCSQKARSQIPTVFPAKTQKAVRSHQGKILESSKDHSEKRRSTHHKKKRDVKLPKPSRTKLKNSTTVLLSLGKYKQRLTMVAVYVEGQLCY